MVKPIENPAGVGEIQVFDVRDSWKTKSGGVLTVLFAFPEKVIQEDFFRYNREELKNVPRDIRGLRSYVVRNLPKGGIGGLEFHRIRVEIIFGLEGSVKWECEDLFEEKREVILTPEKGILLPPFILHTYEALENNSGLLVVANTLFFPDDPKTHDTYPLQIFRDIQRRYK